MLVLGKEGITLTFNIHTMNTVDVIDPAEDLIERILALLQFFTIGCFSFQITHLQVLFEPILKVGGREVLCRLGQKYWLASS